MKIPVLIIVATCLFLITGASAETRIAANVTANQIWTAAESPYIVEVFAQINPGVSLTIEPGVIVRFAPGQTGLAMAENSTFRVLGQTGSPVLFTSDRSSPAPNDYSGIGVGHSGATAVLQYCVIEYAGNGLAISGPIQATAVEIRHCQNGVVSAGGYGISQAANLFIHDNTVGAFAEEFSTLVLTACIVQNNVCGVCTPSSNTASVSLFQSDISHNSQAGAHVLWGTIDRCTVTDNGGFGVLMGPSSTATNSNIYANSGPGLAFGDIPLGSYAQANGNNIHDNSPYDAQAGWQCRVASIDATLNWWGTDDPEAVARRIYDKSDNAALTAAINFLPMQAGVDVLPQSWGAVKALYR